MDPGEYAVAMPSLGELKVPAVVNEQAQDGADAVDASPGYDSSGEFDALVEPFEWAIFAFAPGSEPLVEAELEFTTAAPPATAFIAISDYDTQAWDFGAAHELGAGTTTVTLPLITATHLSPSGSVFLAVVAPVGSLFNLDAIFFRTLGNDPPAAELTADPPSGDVPLLVSLDASGSTDADGTITLYEWDFQGDGTIDQDTGATPTNSINYAAGGIFEPTVYVTDEEGATGTASVTVTVTVDGNIPPNAVLEADISEGDPTFTVNFDASASEDPDGSIANFKWDGDGDGTFEGDTGTTPSYSFDYTAPGFHSAKVRVTDNLGLADESPAVPVIAHGWVVVPLQAENILNQAELIQLRNGPALAFTGQDQNILYYAARSRYGDNAADWFSVQLTDTSSGLAGLVEVEAKAAVAYTDSTDLPREVIYTRHNSGAFTDIANWDFVTVVPDDSSAQSFGIVDGTPALVYSTIAVPQSVYYTRSTTPTGLNAADWQHVLLSDQAVATSSSMAIINGNPAVVFRQFFGSLPDQFNYARSTTPGGMDAADWVAIQLPMDNPDSYFPEFSLAEANGKPAISLGNGTNDSLEFAFSSSANGTDPLDWQFLPLDSSASLIARPSVLGVHDGKPLILYNDFAQAPLRLAESATPAGTALADWSIEDLPTGQLPSSISDFATAEINGFTAILFCDDADDTVKYAIRF